MSWRAQVWNGARWVDGMLSKHRRHADDDAVAMARQYQRPTRVIVEPPDPQGQLFPTA